MSEHSAIEWTDATWNPVRGCTKVSPGCKNCYAETFAERWRGVPGHPYEQGFDLRLVPEKLSEPLKWRKPKRIFVNSMSDLFHKDVPFEYIDKVFAVMNATAYRLPLPADPTKAERWHTYQVLTKRADRMAEYMLSRAKRYDLGEHPIFEAGRGKGGALRGHGMDVMNAGAVLQWPPSNVWLGTSVEDQQRADERIPHLLKCPAAVRFLSCEPLMGPLDMSGILYDVQPATIYAFAPEYKAIYGDQPVQGTLKRSGVGIGPGWVIIGCESNMTRVGRIGHGEYEGATEADWIGWAEDIVRQCRHAHVPVFIKQIPVRGMVEHDVERFPASLQVREFPRPASAPA